MNENPLKFIEKSLKIRARSIWTLCPVHISERSSLINDQRKMQVLNLLNSIKTKKETVAFPYNEVNTMRMIGPCVLFYPITTTHQKHVYSLLQLNIKFYFYIKQI